jgi:hypothetical protein
MELPLTEAGIGLPEIGIFNTELPLAGACYNKGRGHVRGGGGVADQIYQDDGRNTRGNQQDHKGNWGHHSDQQPPFAPPADTQAVIDAIWGSLNPPVTPK